MPPRSRDMPGRSKAAVPRSGSSRRNERAPTRGRAAAISSGSGRAFWRRARRQRRDRGPTVASKAPPLRPGDLLRGLRGSPGGRGWRAPELRPPRAPERRPRCRCGSRRAARRARTGGRMRPGRPPRRAGGRPRRGGCAPACPCGRSCTRGAPRRGRARAGRAMRVAPLLRPGRSPRPDGGRGDRGRVHAPGFGTGGRGTGPKASFGGSPDLGGVERLLPGDRLAGVGRHRGP